MSVEVLRVKSRRRTEFVDVTDQVKRVVETSGVASGVCYVYVPHTTAGVTINEHFDPDVATDLEGVFERRRFLDLLRYFIVFEDSAAAGGGDGRLVKKMAGYHQFHAVNAAVEEACSAVHKTPPMAPTAWRWHTWPEAFPTTAPGRRLAFSSATCPGWAAPPGI